MITEIISPSTAVSFNQRAAVIFSRYGISNNEHYSIAQLAEQKNLNTSFLVDVLNYFDDFQDIRLEEFNKYSIPVLVDYLQRSHRYYVEKKLPEIEQTINILGALNDSQNSSINLLRCFFYDYRNELLKHFEMEEKLLFPYSKFLDQANCFNISLPLSLIYIQQYSVKEFTQQHQSSHEDLAKIKEAILSYSPSSTNQSPHRIIIEQLKNFEEDLQFHAMIEDEILVPKLQKMENRIKAVLN